MLSHTHSIPALSGSTNETGEHTHDTINKTILTNDFNGTALVYNLSGSGRVSYAGRTLTEAGNHFHTVTTNTSTTGASGSSSSIDIRPRRLNSIVWKRVN